MKILIAGDFCPQNRVASLFDNDDFSSVLEDVRAIVSDTDYSIVNLECPVTKGGEQPIVKQGPNLHCSVKGVEALKWCGFSCVTLANNHFCDYGEKGVANTLEECQIHGIDVVGGGYTIQEASRILFKQIGGEMLAVINCCEHEFSIATDKAGGSNPLSPIQQYYAIREAKKKANYVLVIVHGGHEHFQLPSPRMKETYRFFIESGADAVINHHQHCYSGYEIYKEKPIFYGLGNFCFDKGYSLRDKWHEGYLVLLNIDDCFSFEIIPYYQCSEHARIQLLKRNSFDDNLERLNAIIADSKELSKAVTLYYEECAKYYSEIFEPCNNRVYLAFRRRGWLPSFIARKRRLRAENYICCEAHRDKLMYYVCHK